MAKKDKLTQNAEQITGSNPPIAVYTEDTKEKKPKRRGYEKKTAKFQVAIQPSVKEKAQDRLYDEGVTSLNDLINTLLRKYGEYKIDI